MSDYVEVKLPTGEWVFRRSATIKEEELEYPMRCCWQNKDGKPCHAPMIPERRTKPLPCINFRQKNGEKVHILGCACDERREKETVNHVDRRAKNHKTEDLWKAMMKDKNRKVTKKKSTGPIAGSDGSDEDPDSTEPRERPIQRKATLPKSPESLADVLLNLPIEAEYANTRVSDLIIDQRTVDLFRERGIKKDSYVLVLAKRLAPVNRNFEANKNEIVLVDCNYDASKRAAPDGCLQFRLSLSGETKEHMYKYLKLKGENTYIVIFARWQKDPDNEGVYIAKNVDDDHIGRFRLPD